jgi:hypothetical protein
VNVELPDGTVVEDVPDSITKVELATKLKANGMKVPDEWLVPAKRKIGVLETALRTAGEAAIPAVRTLGLALSTVARVGGQSAQEAVIGKTEELVGGMESAYGQKPDEEMNTAGQVLGGVASMPIALAGQGVAPGINRAAEVLKRGGTGSEAAVAGGVTGAVEQALIALPMHVGGKVAEKIGGGVVRQAAGGAATGAALNVPAGIAGRAAESAALPEGERFKDLKQEPLDTKALLMDAGVSAALGAFGAGRAHVKMKKAAAEAVPPFPADKMEDVGNGDYRAPNGATITKEAWESSSKTVREGWLKEEPKPEPAPSEPKTPSPEDELKRIQEEHPSGPVAEVARQVAVEREKQTRIKADAEELRKAAHNTTDESLRQAFLKRADKLDPPEKIPVGETKEGQPEIKTEPPGKIPVGETKEIPEPYAGEKIPTGEATEVTRSGVQPEPDKVPVGAAKELYIPPEKRNAADQVVKQESVQQERVQGNEVGQAAETGGGNRVQRAAEGTGETKPVAKDETFDFELGLPKIDEGFMEQQQRAAVASKPKPTPRGIEQSRKALEEGMQKGTVNKDAGALALWALDKNPNLAHDLRIEAAGEHPKYPTAKGAYGSADKIVKLFGADKQNAQTVAHEILHHSERMMPPEVQAGIRREWRKQLRATMDKATPETREIYQDAIRATVNNDKAAYDRVVQAFSNKKIPLEDYRLLNPTEFWAVNAARILHERFTGRGSWRAQARQWLREMVEHVKGLVGVRSDAAVLKALDDVLNPKVTKGLRPGAEMIRERYKGTATPKEELSVGTAPTKRVLPEETKTDKFERKLFDRFNRVAKLQAAEPPKSNDADIYQADQLYQGRAQHRGDVLEREFIKPLGKQLEAAKKVGITVQHADDYLMALHAPERNREIAKINPKMQDGGSGLTNKQAKAIIDGFTPEQRAHLDKIADTIHRLNKEKLDGLVADGLIKPEVRDALNQKFKKYVPLKTLDQEDVFTGIGQGYSMRANDIVEALGRKSKASSPIAASLMDASRAIIRGEKARVDQAIWKFASDKSAQDFIAPYDPKKPPPEVMGRKKGPDGQVKAVVDPRKVQDLTVDLVINGEQQKVFVPDQLLRDQIKKLATTNDPGAVLSTIAKGTGTIGRMLTEFNPAFTLPNAARDAITIGIRAKAHGLDTAKVLGGIPSAWATITKYKLDPKSPAAQEYAEFLRTGGKTGAYGIQDLTDTMKRLEKAGAELGYTEHKSGYSRKVKNVLKDAAHVISNANEVMEYAGRFSAYQQAKAAGKSPREAAAIAKEITVNFNRSGEYGRALNSVLVFANAALQGLRNSIVYAKSPVVRRNMLGLVALGAAAQAYNEMVGGMDAETNEPNINTQNDAMADKNLMVLAPDSAKGVKVPLPPEYSWLFALGRRFYRGMSQGTVAKDAAGSVGNLIDAVLPVRLPEADSGALSAAKAITPTLIAPYVDIWTNQNYFGQPIVPDPHDKTSPPPSYTVSRTTTSDIAKGVSQLANTVTGGDKVTPGLSQKALGPLVSPEGIEHLIGFYTGGLGQLAMQSKNLVKSATEDKPLDVNKLPIANRFVFQEPKSYTSRRYKELAPELEYARDYQKAGTPEKIDPKIARTLPAFNASERELPILFKRLRAAATDAEKEGLQTQIKAAQSRVVRAYNGQPAQ